MKGNTGMPEVSSFDEQFAVFRDQFLTDHPEIAECPRLLVAHLHALDSNIDHSMTAAGHVVTVEIEAMCSGFLMLTRFLKEEFGDNVSHEL